MTKPVDAQALTVDELRQYVRNMVERETRGNGDQLNALDRVAKRCGLTASAVRRLSSGQTKDPGIGVYGKVRKAYQEHLDDEIAKLVAERESERIKSDILDIGFVDEEIAALRKKLTQIQARLKGEAK